MDRSRLQVLGCARLVWLRLSRWGFGNPRHQPRTRNGRWGAGGSQGLGLPAHSVSTCQAPFLLHPAAMAAACTSGAAAQKNLRERERGSAVPAPLPRPGRKSRSLEDRNGHRVSKAAGGGVPKRTRPMPGNRWTRPRALGTQRDPGTPGNALKCRLRSEPPRGPGRTREMPGRSATMPPSDPRWRCRPTTLTRATQAEGGTAVSPGKHIPQPTTPPHPHPFANLHPPASSARH